MTKTWDDLSLSAKGGLYYDLTGKNPYIMEGIHTEAGRAHIEEHEPFVRRVYETRNKVAQIHKEQYRLYLQSSEWKEKARRILERDGFTCRICDARTNLEVHHLTYDRKYHESDYDLITVCRRCHEAIHA